MDTYILILLVIGLLLSIVTLGSGWIGRLPLSYALIYLIVGIALGPYGFGLINLRPDAKFLMRMSEFVVIVSVFSCGLKMNRSLQVQKWQSSIRLILFLMPISIGAIAIISHWFLGMGWAAAILLGAILTPTDPVLASEVQLSDIEDKDELRFALTSEGGLNDAFAFPFVYFGIYALKDNNWGNWLRDWVLVDVIWAIAAGIVMGVVVAKTMVWIDRHMQHRRPAEDVLEDFIAFSMILLTYSITELVNGYGFVAVFVAGVVVNKSFKRDPEKHESQLEFIDQIEKLLEVGTILILGSLLLFQPMIQYAGQSILVAVLLFLVIRPVGVWLSMRGYRLPSSTLWLISWFGIRGVGSIYYLTYAMGKGLKGETAEQISWITLTAIVLSVIVHGISATPLMKRYEKNLAVGR
ncbi:MAG: cation:proton antiporter [Xenococcaceae cyanobacterium]